MAVINRPRMSARAQTLLGGNPYTNPSELPAQPPAKPIYSPAQRSASKKAIFGLGIPPGTKERCPPREWWDCVCVGHQGLQGRHVGPTPEDFTSCIARGPRRRVPQATCA